MYWIYVTLLLTQSIWGGLSDSVSVIGIYDHIPHLSKLSILNTFDLVCAVVGSARMNMHLPVLPELQLIEDLIGPRVFCSFV